MSPSLLVATTNRNKVLEMEPVLLPALRVLGLGLEALPPGAPEVDEDRGTFAGNAARKALAAAAWSGSLCLAEDSGLEVAFLAGEPGVRSARFSGQGTAANNRLLLEKLAGVPRPQRQARFVTAAVVKAPAGPAFVAQGSAEGEILDQPAGERGFGYDPVFLSKDLGCSFAEATLDDKRRVSHRSRALRAVRGYLFEVAAVVDSPTAGTPGQAAGTGVPDHQACLRLLAEAGCPPRLVGHQLAVGRVCREMALLALEAGQPADPVLAEAAGLLHDVGRVREMAAPGEGRQDVPRGVVPHAWFSARWAEERGLDARLARAVMVHGLDSLASGDYFPATFEERVLMLADKMVEDSSFVGIAARLEALGNRYPAARDLIEQVRPTLFDLEASFAAAAGLGPELYRRDLAACLDVAVLPDGAGVEEIEAAALR